MRHEVGILAGVFVDPDPLQALHGDHQPAVRAGAAAAGSAPRCPPGGPDRGWRSRCWVVLRHQRHQPVAAHRVVDQLHRAGLPDHQRQGLVGVDDQAAQRQHRQRIGQLRLLVVVGVLDLGSRGVLAACGHPSGATASMSDSATSTWLSPVSVAGGLRRVRRAGGHRSDSACSAAPSNSVSAIYLFSSDPVRAAASCPRRMVRKRALSICTTRQHNCQHPSAASRRWPIVRALPLITS